VVAQRAVGCRPKLVFRLLADWAQLEVLMSQWRAIERRPEEPGPFIHAASRRCSGRSTSPDFKVRSGHGGQRRRRSISPIVVKGSLLSGCSGGP
jgi:hypothetical protein